MRNKHVVLYTDGGARPNPGQAGSGVHGYSYIKDGEVGKPLTFSQDVTVIGYMAKIKDKPLADKHKVTPVRFHDYVISWTGKESNNFAELFAIIRGVEFVLEDHEKVMDESTIKTIRINTDSKISIQGLGNVLDPSKRAGYVGRSKLRASVLDSMVKFAEMLEYKGIDIIFRHVPAHSGVYGNEIADSYATMAVTGGKTHIANRTAVGYLNHKPFSPPLLNGKFIYFKTNTKRRPGTYATLNVHEESWIGRIDPKRTAFSLYRGSPVPDVDNIMNMLDGNAKQTLGAVVRLNALYSPYLNRLYTMFGSDVYHMKNGKVCSAFVNHNNEKKIVNEDIVGNVIDPVALTKEADKKFRILDNYMNDTARQELYEYIDITKSMYNEQNKSGTPSVGRASGFRNIKFKSGGKWAEHSFDVNFKLEFGVNTPPLNSMNKIKKGDDVRMYIVVDWLGTYCDYATVLIVNDEMVVTSSDGSFVVNN